ncbi:MAG: hypothetical protein HY553_22865 [Elusimicrobia bacterium]|nr:hypothetical protein [Elusimicrobiota bacterium]
MRRPDGRRRSRSLAPILGACLALWAAPRWAAAADSAALQFTVPAPDPVTAGETLALQALAINTGNAPWAAGSYYWVAEIYDLEYRLLARTDQLSPQEVVQPGAVAAISLPFPVPETMEGRKLYRVFLIKETQTLVQSDYKPFQVTEKPIAPPPEAVDYHLEGNLTFSYKNSSRNKWGQHNGATSINTVGKIKDSSYLINVYLLHKPGEVVDPFIVVANLYAPWGTIYAGDINPTLHPLSVSGQGMRGGMLEQRRGRFDWTVVGGQTIESLPGTATANGRYARTLYAAKGRADIGWGVKADLNYFVSADETASLSTDPKSPQFRGPSLVPQKNSGAGLGLTWEPISKLAFGAYYQSNSFHSDVSKPGVKDNAWRGEFSLSRRLFKFKSYVQRTGPNYRALAAPGIVGDRMTFDGALGLFPAPWYSLSISGNQYRDNLASDPKKLKTTQRVVSIGNNFTFATGTNFGVSVSQNSAIGQPATQLNNQTTTMGTAVGQTFEAGHSVSFNVQLSQFRDKTTLAHDLDTQTAGVASTWRLPRSCTGALGVSVTQAKDKFDGSKRQSQTASPSLAVPISKKWSSQYYGTYNQSKNTSNTFPSEITNISVNTEFTYARPQNSVTVGVGANQNKDKTSTANTYKEVTALMRWSYSF